MVSFNKICNKYVFRKKMFFQILHYMKNQQILSAYHNLNDSDKQKIVDFILWIGEYDPSKIIKLKDTSEQNTQSPDNIVHLINMGEIIYIDTHPQPVSAGRGNIYIDDSPIPKLYPSTPISSKDDYCVRVSGESMYQEILCMLIIRQRI